uniref:IST1 homolog n=1 Tax=Myxobolus squamalis TaxID=59785 RepID=A0A6B2G549_MYXSQ
MPKPSGKFNVEKLKVNCKLAIKRIQVLQQKKAECLKRERKKIADLIASDKIDTARIKVEQLIREDYIVEALETVENHCETVLSRLSLILSQKNVDEGLTPILASIIWTTPRLSYDIAELQNISDQLYLKFGKAFHEAALSNSLKIVNERVVSCLSVQPPDSNMVEHYLKTIADAHKLSYEPNIVEFNDTMVHFI